MRNRHAESEVLPYCAAERITLIAYSPLDRGKIVDSIPASILRRYGMTRAQVMLNWVTRSETVVATPKAAGLRHLEVNAGSVRVRFDPSEYEQISTAQSSIG